MNGGFDMARTVVGWFCHSPEICRPGHYRVVFDGLNGWFGGRHCFDAVVDDFGNLVKVAQ
jgi:hypothetical protein